MGPRRICCSRGARRDVAGQLLVAGVKGGKDGRQLLRQLKPVAGSDLEVIRALFPTVLASCGVA